MQLMRSDSVHVEVCFQKEKPCWILPALATLPVLPPGLKQPATNTENKTLTPSPNRINISFQSHAQFKFYIFSLPKIQCSIPDEDLPQSIKQTSIYTVSTPTHHFTVQEEGSSVQLQVVLGKNIVQAGYIFLDIFQRGLCCLAALRY